MQFLNYNRRNAATLLPLIKQKVNPGATIVIDMWWAYCGLETELAVSHKTVNPKRQFINANGDHTNNAEGVHGMIKRMAQQQFNQLPSVTSEGLPLLIDILVFQVNVDLKFRTVGA